MGLVFTMGSHAEAISSEELLLLREKGGAHLLKGRLYVALAPFLNQREFSLEEIVSRLCRKFPVAEIYYALHCLQEKGLIEEGGRLPKAWETACAFLGVPLDLAEKRLNETPISLKVFGKCKVGSFQRELKKSPLRQQKKGSFTLIITDHYRRSELKEWNIRSLRSKEPWMLVRPFGTEILVGPLFLPGVNACFECLLSRLEDQEIEAVFLEKRKKREPFMEHLAALPTNEALASGMAVNEVFKWVVQGFNKELEGKILSFDAMNFSLQSHSVIRRPHCFSCGTPYPETTTPFSFESRKKLFTEDGGHRTCSPLQTFETYQHLISPITGIVGSLELEKGTDPSFHVYLSKHRNAHLNFRDRPSLKGLRVTSGGKGKSAEQAKASCLCEAIERWSGQFLGGEIQKKSSYLALQQDAIHPNSYLLFSERQYQTRKAWNSTSSSFHWVPNPFDEEKEIHWTPIWSLTNSHFKWIPTAYCYFAYPGSKKEGNFCVANSNGCASGNTKEEAILQGFFELVERDSVALWWYSRLRRPEVDLTSFSDPYISEMIQIYKSKGREVWVLDLNFDLGVPSFAAFSRSLKGKEEILFGFGSHFDPQVALLRSLTEMNQCFGILSKRDHLKKEIREWLERVTVQSDPYLLPDPKLKMKREKDYPRLDTHDLKEDVRICQKIIESKGMEMLVLDQTRSEIGLPVVRVIVPGLRHFWNRFAPGRLYEVPLQLGLVKEKLKETDLNPIPMFL